MKLTIPILIVILLLNTITIASSTESIDMSEAYGLVSTISDADDCLPKDTEGGITRKLFVEAAVKAFNCDLNIKSDINFVDVKPDNELYKILQTAVAYRLITDGEAFFPDEQITLDQSLKICVIAAGYTVKAEIYGGFPKGYLYVANDIGLFSGIKGAEMVDVSVTYNLLFNTLTAESLEQVRFGKEPEFTTKKKETVLSKLYDIYSVKGILNANEYTSLNGEGKKNTPGEIQIEGITYKVSGNFNEFLGYSVTAYYINKDDKNTIVYIHPKNNNTLNISSNDSATYNDFKIKYDDGKKTTEAKLSRGFDYIYNGKSFSGYTDDSFIPETGDLILIDNDRDDRYDIVIANDYYYMKADVINKLKKEIIDNHDNTHRLSLDEADCIYSIYNLGDREYISLGELGSGEVLAVKRSKNDMLISIIICTDTLSGTVEQINQGDKSIVVNSTEYKTTQDFMQNNLSSIKCGSSYYFNLGLYGEIVGISGREESLSYGYMLTAKMQSNISGKLNIKIFNTGSEFQIFECADKIILDGEGGKESYDVWTALTSKGYISPQLIRYAVNSDGKLSMLDLAKDRTVLIDENEQNENDSLSRFSFSSTYNYRQQIFYPYFNIDKAVIFKVPTDIKDEEGFSVGHSFTDGNYTTVTPYDVGLDGCAKALVYMSDEKSVAMTQSTEIILVEKVVQALNDDGESCQKVYCWQSGNFIEYYIGSDVQVIKNGVNSNLSSGDIVRISKTRNTIISLIVDFIGETLSPNKGAGIAPFNQSSSILQYQAGKLYSLKNSYAFVSDTKDSNGSYDFSIGSLKNVKIPGLIAIFDKRSGEIRPADASYIKTYLGSGNDADYIVVKQHYMQSNFAVIYSMDR